jgi:tetratricopeptide (TPR) repeat protein
MKEWISEAFARHERDPAGLALELETKVNDLEDPADLARFLRLSNHTIGSHLGDWSRARALAERAAVAPAAQSISSAVMTQVALAQFLGGAPELALATEARGLALSDDDPVFQLIGVRLQLAEALIAQRRVREGGALYDATVLLAERRAGGVAALRELAVASNNIASQLLESGDDDGALRDLLERAAIIAHRSWAEAGTWVNEERALYLLALVCNRLGQPARARGHALRALEMIEANGDEPVDCAFLNLALAHSYRLEGDEGEFARSSARAQDLAATFSDAGLVDWFTAERTKVERAERL